MKKKSILSIFLLIFPMLIAIGFSTWIIVYEVIFNPQYNSPSSISEMFDFLQETTYSGQIQLPVQTDGDEIDTSANTISYQYKAEEDDEDKFVACTDSIGPKNAGIYDVLISVTGEINGTCQVKYTIKKADPIIDSTPVIISFYEGESVPFSGGAAVGVIGEDLDGKFSYTNKSGTASVEYIGNNISCSTFVSMTYTPTENLENGSINYNNLIFNVPVSLNAVAHINSTTYYGTIEKALAAASANSDSANKTVYVIPELDSDPIIRKSCSIDNGVSLILPYEGVQYNGRHVGELADCDFPDVGDLFADETSNDLLKNNVIINDGITLTINSGGTLFIGGIVGNEADPGKKENGNTDDMILSGQTAGAYSQITMNPNSKIISNGTVQCLGYIKESENNNNSNVEFVSGTVYLPFVVYDYQGGWETIGAYTGGGSLTSAPSATGNIFPFMVFDLPNIKSTIIFYYSAQMIGYADIYSRATSAMGMQLSENQHNNTTVNVIGNKSSSSIINLADDAYAVIKIDPGNENGFTVKDNTNGKTNIKIYGGASTGNMKMTIKAAFISVDVSTQNVLFPVSWKYSIELYDGDYTFVNKMKFMPGSSLYIDSTANATISEQMIFYPDTSSEDYVYSQNMKSQKATCTFNGMVTIESSAYFGGDILTTAKDAFLTIKCVNDNLSVTSIEGVGGQQDTTTTKFTQTASITETATGNIGSSTTNDSFAQGAYISMGNYWTIAEGYTTYSIIYNANGGTFSNGSTTKTETSPIKEDTTAKITSATSTRPILEHYEFDGWYLVSTNQTDNDLLIGSSVTDPTGTTSKAEITAYAKWKIKEYKIEYKVEYKNDTTSTNFDNKNNPEYYYYNSTNIEILNPTDSSLIFYGWYLDEDYDEEFDNSKKYSGTELFSKADSEGLLTLYGYFTDLEEFTVSFETNHISSISQQTIIENECVTNLNELSAILKNEETNPNYDSYFVGWYTDKDCTKGNEFTNETGVNSSITLYAKWVPKEYSVKYLNASGNIINEYTKYIKSGTTVSIKTAPAITKDPTPGTEYDTEYSFATWTYGTDSFDSETNYSFNSNVTLTPKFNESYWCNLTFSGSGANVTVTDTNGVNYTKDNNRIKKDTIVNISVSFSYNNDTKKFTIKDTDTDTTTDYTSAAKVDNYTINKHKEIYAYSKYQICVTYDTQVTLSNGQKKEIGKIDYSDLILAWDFVTGSYVETNIAILFAHAEEECEVIYLEFDDGTLIKIINEHGFISKTENDFVILNNLNYKNYIGETFAKIKNIENNEYEFITLKNAYSKIENVASYSIQSSIYLNFFVNDFFSITPPHFEGFFDYFEIGKDLKYDEDKMNEEIERYGLFTYDDLSKYVTYDEFIAFNGKYMKILIGRGTITFDQLILLINSYLST